MKVRVRATSEAHSQALLAAVWWRANRPAARDLFIHELAGALDLLERAPNAGRRYPAGSIPGLRRLLLPSTRYHVYYVHDSEAGEVIVLAVWSAVRGRGPRV